MPKTPRRVRPPLRAVEPKPRLKSVGYVHAAFGLLDVLLIVIVRPGWFWSISALLISLLMDLVYVQAMKQRKDLQDRTWKQIEAEGIIAQGRKHRITLVPVGGALLAALVCLYYALIAGTVHIKTHQTQIPNGFHPYVVPKTVVKIYNIPVDKIMVGAFFICIMLAVWVYIDWKSTIRLVTRERVVLLRNPPTLLALMRFRMRGYYRNLLTNVGFDTRFPDNMFGYGVVSFETQSQKDPIVNVPWVPEPDVFAHQIDSRAADRAVHPR